MNFDLDAGDVELRNATRDLCRGRFSMDRVRSLGSVDRGLWRALGEAGVFSLTLPTEKGGAGLGVAQAVLVFEELGRALVPGPLVGSHLAAGFVGGVGDGSRVAGIVERVSGVLLVEHLASLDDLLVVDGEGVWQVEPQSLHAERVERPLDPLTPVHAVRELPQGKRVGRAEDAARCRLNGGVLTAALALGIASATTESATSYAKERVQFDRVIGSFQAVKHMLADMFVRAEVARAAVYAAGCLLDDPRSGDAEAAVATAKLLACEAALVNGKASIQVHGGMGFTWEVDAHLFLKRAVVLATTFGTADEHAESMAAWLVRA